MRAYLVPDTGVVACRGGDGTGQVFRRGDGRRAVGIEVENACKVPIEVAGAGDVQGLGEDVGREGCRRAEGVAPGIVSKSRRAIPAGPDNLTGLLFRSNKTLPAS